MRHYEIELNYEFDYCLFFINSFLTAVKWSQSVIYVITFESLRCKVLAVTVAITWIHSVDLLHDTIFYNKKYNIYKRN